MRPGQDYHVARSRQVCIYWLWKHCLLLAILPEGRANTYRHRKILSVECLSRANSWSLSSCAFPAGSCPAEVYECSSVRMHGRTNLRIATETRPARNIPKAVNAYTTEQDRLHPVMRAHEMHAHEVHAREMHAYEIRAIKCTPMMYTPMRCMPVRYTPMRHTHEMNAREVHAYETHAHETHTYETHP
jgi:hypothetical protein